MRINAAVLGTILLLELTAVGVAEDMLPTVLAAVDANGHVVPSADNSSPCPNPASIDVGAAQELVTRLAPAENVRPDFALAVAKVESHYVSTALSPKGAFGLMQLTPDTAERFSVNICDPEGNVRGGLRFLRLLQDRYRNPLTVLAAYNAGEEAVRRAGGMPPYPETVRFVADVMNELNGWPSARSAGAGNVASQDSLDDVAEENAPAPDVAEVAKSERDAPLQWSAGFVMHIQ